jgi:ABC-type branched-subunit amino acid transport system substrate-binding protein
MIKRKALFYQLFLTLLIWGQFVPLAQAQRPRGKDKLEIDPVAHNLIEQGKRFLSNGNYRMAWDSFDAAIERPFHQESTLAIYLSGFAAFKGKQSSLAKQRFERIVNEFPRSRYADEARYHLALMSLEQQPARFHRLALETLVDLQQNASEPGLREDAADLIQSYAYAEASVTLLEDLYDNVLFSQKPLFLKPLCFRLVEQEMVEDAESYYGDYLWMGGEEVPELEALFAEETVVEVRKRDIYKLAMVLPLHHTGMSPAGIDSLESIPARSKLALEFYEGFQFAIQEHELYGQKKIMIRVWDSQRDSLRTEDILYQLDGFRPDILVGDIYNNESAQLSEWAETRVRTQVVPLSPSESLIQDKRHTFLAHPSVKEHGKQMALFAFDSLGLQKVAVWTDQRSGTELLAATFRETFMQLGGEIVEMVVDSVYDRQAISDIEQLVRELKNQEVQGSYIPILSNQETCGLILSLIDRNMGPNMKIMGSPHWWLRYREIDRTLKERFGLYFTSSYLVDTENDNHQQFFRNYVRRFNHPPSEYAIQGYDLGRYLLAVLDSYSVSSGMTLSEYLRQYPVFRAGHTNFQFGGAQSNQFVNIGQFQSSGIVKVNGGRALNLDDLFIQERN